MWLRKCSKLRGVSPERSELRVKLAQKITRGLKVSRTIFRKPRTAKGLYPIDLASLKTAGIPLGSAFLRECSALFPALSSRYFASSCSFYSRLCQLPHLSPPAGLTGRQGPESRSPGRSAKPSWLPICVTCFLPTRLASTSPWPRRIGSGRISVRAAVLARPLRHVRLLAFCSQMVADAHAGGSRSGKKVASTGLTSKVCSPPVQGVGELFQRGSAGRFVIAIADLPSVR